MQPSEKSNPEIVFWLRPCISCFAIQLSKSALRRDVNRFSLRTIGSIRLQPKRSCVDQSKIISTALDCSLEKLAKNFTVFSVGLGRLQAYLRNRIARMKYRSL